MRSDESPVLQARTVLRGWILLCGAGLGALGLHLVSAGRNWPLGDWLINYAGGFVRRGLMGQVLLLCGNALHLDPIRLAVAICLLCYAVVLAGLWHLLRRDVQPWWAAFAVVSPAMLTFPLLSTRAGFHKEVLLYAVLVLFLFLFRPGRNPGPIVVAASLGAACVLLILSHEPIVFCLPYLFVIPMLATQDVRYCLRALGLPAIVTVLTFGVVLQHIGTADTVAAICRSVHASASDPCADPIGFLTMTRSGQLAMVRENVSDMHYFRIYPVLLLLSALPLVMGMTALWRFPAVQRPLALLAGAAGLAGAASIALFRFGPDWGRWIAMHVVCFTLLLLWVADRVGSSQSEESVAQQPSRGDTLTVRFAWTVGLVLYATCWSMPGFGNTPLHGFVGLMLHHP